VYTELGAYFVTLTVTSEFGTDSVTHEFIVAAEEPPHLYYFLPDVYKAEPLE
jgi:PKD repeat protein